MEIYAVTGVLETVQWTVSAENGRSPAETCAFFAVVAARNKGERLTLGGC